MTNGSELDVDCGGSCEAGCGANTNCYEDADCANGRCRDFDWTHAGQCPGASDCTNHLRDGAEIDVDCGGACAPCGYMQICDSRADCTSRACVDRKCQQFPYCANNKLDGTESDVDCGALDDPECPRCANDKRCLVNTQCASGFRDPVKRRCAVTSCDDHVRNGLETGVDCGGNCPPCPAGQPCTSIAECESLVCGNYTCVGPSCTNRKVDGSESAIDCGGMCPTTCAASLGCRTDTDCATGTCGALQTCLAASCSDELISGDETGVDCGGACPAKCATAIGCRLDGDCASATCRRGRCVPSTCNDGSKSTGESDIDCGGPCAPCETGKACFTDVDCGGARCTVNTCRETPLTVLSSIPASGAASSRTALFQLVFSQILDTTTLIPCVGRNTPTGCNLELADTLKRVYAIGIAGQRRDLPASTISLAHAPLAALAAPPPGELWRHRLTVRGGTAGPHALSGATLDADLVVFFNATTP